jgi:uncharacterized membrane protein
VLTDIVALFVSAVQVGMATGLYGSVAITLILALVSIVLQIIQGGHH